VFALRKLNAVCGLFTATTNFLLEKIIAGGCTSLVAM
jgi:hypothetical protein